MQKVTGILSFALCFVTQISISARAETVSYPEKNPLFMMEVPKGWEAKHEHGAVKIVAEANALFLLQHVDNVKDESSAEAALPQLADMQDVKVAVPARAVQMGDFKGLITQLKGRDKAGNETLWQAMIFAAKEDDYYLFTCFWTNDDGPKTATIALIFSKSLKPASAN